MDAAESRVRDLMKKITCFVFHYYGIFESMPIHAQLPELPLQFGDVIIRNVIKTLSDAPLLQLTSGFVNATYRIERMVIAYVKSFHNEFTDEYFIEWVIRISTLSAFLYHRGIARAPDVSIDTVSIITRNFNRFQAFRSLGCDV